MSVKELLLGRISRVPDSCQRGYLCQKLDYGCRLQVSNDWVPAKGKTVIQEWIEYL